MMQTSLKKDTSNSSVSTSKPRDKKVNSPVPSTSNDKKRTISPQNVASAKKAKVEKQYKPFDELLNGVVLVISGIQVHNFLL